MAVRHARAAVAIAALAAGATWWTIQQRRDERAIAADPEQAVLDRENEGTTVSVVSEDGTRLHAEVFGPRHAEEGPVVVLVHGWTSSLRFWQYQLQELATDHCVVAFDLRGHGASEPARHGDYSTGALAADLDAVLRTCVPLPSRAVVAGHSMGAMAIVAWAGAHRHGVADRVAGAVLIDTGVERLIAEARILITASALSRLKHAFGRRVLGLPGHAFRRPTPLVNRIVRYVAMSDRATPAQVAFCERLFLDCPADVRAAFGATLAGLDLASSLEALAVPTVVIVGELDRLTPAVHARAIASALPDATLVELEGVGHTAPLEAHVEVTAEIRALAARARGVVSRYNHI